MRLNFTTLSEPMQKVVGHRGTGGTASNHAAFHRPTMHGDTWDAVGQTTAPTVEAQTERPEMSHLSHHGQNKVGRENPSIDAVVPLVPPVPPKKRMNEIDREAFEERAAIIEFDGGLPRGEAERMAAQAPLAWADATRDKGDGDKAGIVKALKVGAGDPATASHWWLIHYPDRNPLEVASYPKATHTEMLEQYPDAIAAEPFTPTIRQPFAPLSASEETAVRTWLALIEETDPAAIAEVLDQCNRDSDARIYFTGRAALDLLNAGFVTDATRIHRKQ